MKLFIFADMSEEASKGEERIPFSKSTNLNRISDSEKSKSIKRKDSPKPEESPKPVEDNNSRPTTPVQDKDEDIAAPLTPTTNLKMLFSAVSPEIRHRESKMRDISIGTDDDDLNDMNVEVVDPPDFGDDYDWKPAGSRKEKSLGLLCAKYDFSLHKTLCVHVNYYNLRHFISYTTAISVILI